MRARLRVLTLIGVTALLPGAAPVGAYAPGRYLIDAAATRAHFRVKALIGGYEGDFREPSGAVVIDPARPDRAAIDVRFPVEKLTTNNPSTDAMLKGGSFFDMDRFPDIRFAADSAPLAEATGDTAIEGRLTMHGVTQPATLTVRLVGVAPDEAPGGSTLHFEGRMTVLRSRFGMGFGRPFVADRVDLTIDAIFRRS